MFSFQNRKEKILLLFVGIIIFFGGIQYGKYLSFQEEPYFEDFQENYELEDKKASQDKIKVHVAGAVFNSGVYQFESGSRVYDAVEKAVPLPDADLDSLNLAAYLEDEKQIIVPSKNPQNNLNSGDINTIAEEENGKIKINTCSEEKLRELPGIGPALSKRIIEYREQNGPFKSIEDLKKVSGIGEKKFEAIKDLITL